MTEYSKDETLIENLVGELSKLPSIGKKSAQRLAYYLLQQKSESVQKLAQSMLAAKQNVHACTRCGNYTERDLCRICSSTRRHQNLICVVEKPADVIAFERSDVFGGVYHILGGSISPLDGIGPAELNMASLFERCQEGVELILALNTNADGEATSMYIAQRLTGKNVRITRLARGIPVGSELEYVDELTVQRAFEGRVELS